MSRVQQWDGLVPLEVHRVHHRLRHQNLPAQRDALHPRCHVDGRSAPGKALLLINLRMEGRKVSEPCQMLRHMLRLMLDMK